MTMMSKSTAEYTFTDETIELLFGHEAGERESVDRLMQYYLRRSDYDSIRSNLPLKILVGFKGTGKSALLKVSYEEDNANKIPAIWIRPDDVSELYDELITENNFLRLITLWKKGLARLIACRIAEDWVCVSKSDAETAILWAEQVGYRNKDLISQIATKLKPLTQKYIEAISDPRKCIGEHHILERLVKKNEIRVYIDDLDRGWDASSEQRTRLSALINALGDLTSDIRGLQARLSLRTDVYTLIRENDESTDKFEGNVVWCTWRNHDILVALAKRIQTFLGADLDEKTLTKKHQKEIAKLLSPIFVQTVEGTRAWNKSPIYHVLMSLVRSRPRDLVKLCTFAAKRAKEEGKTTIEGKHLVDVVEDYSSGRMQDLINEFKSECPNIHDLIYNMGPTTKEIREKGTGVYLYQTKELYDKIKNVMGNVPVRFTTTEAVSFHDIAHFLFKIGFIDARRDLPDGKKERVNYDQKKQLLKPSVGDLGYSWEIHPAYRGALSRKLARADRWEDTVEFYD